MSHEDVLSRVLTQDPRYKREAYVFAQESLDHAMELRERAQQRRPAADEDVEPEHIDGRQLCEAFRDLAFERFGMLSVEVLRSWGMHTTGDLGKVVFNLIDAGIMKANDDDKVEDFEDHFEFETAFEVDVDLIS